MADAGLPRYDPSIYPKDDVYKVETVGALGAPMDSWVPELAWRMTGVQSTGVVVDWAIMINAYREEDGAGGPRRRVERIDICDSEVHVHRFCRSSDPNDDLGKCERLISLSAGDEFSVDCQFDDQMVLVSHEWENRMRRWIDG